MLEIVQNNKVLTVWKIKIGSLEKWKVSVLFQSVKEFQMAKENSTIK